MKKTKHFQSRMSQRGVSQALVDLVCWFGKRDHRNRIFLNTKNIDQQLAAIESSKKALLRARSKGGVVVVEESGQLITTYIRGRKNAGKRRAQ